LQAARERSVLGKTFHWEPERRPNNDERQRRKPAKTRMARSSPLVPVSANCREGDVTRRFAREAFFFLVLLAVRPAEAYYAPLLTTGMISLADLIVVDTARRATA
jgi:hypothetical protein